MKTFFAVFTNPNPEMPDIFWGAFPDRASVDNALNEWLDTHPYWELEEFIIRELPFGELL